MKPENDPILDKLFVIDFVSRRGLIENDFLTEEQARQITDEQMAQVADAIGDGMSDGRSYPEAVAEAVKVYADRLPV